MPVIRKKEHDFLGMFEYKKEAEQQVLKALIYGELFDVKQGYINFNEKLSLSFPVKRCLALNPS